MLEITCGNSNALTKSRDQFFARGPNQWNDPLEAFSPFVSCDGRTVTGQKPYS